jgi:predicted kinase
MPASEPFKPTLVVVSGRPGSGKSTLARRLADALRCPLVSRDEINEGIRRTLGRGPEPPDKDLVAGLTFDAFLRVLALLVSCDVTLVAEAAFQDPRWRICLEPLLPTTDLRVVHCIVDPQVARERVLRRLEGREPAPSHVDSKAPEPGWPAVRPFESLALPVPSLTVSTADEYDPPFEAIVAFAGGYARLT